MKKERENIFDLLRTVSMIAVIMIYVSLNWVNGFIKPMADGGNTCELANSIVAYIYNSIFPQMRCLSSENG